MSNLTQTELEEQVRLLSERLRQAVSLYEQLEARVERLEGRRGRLSPDIGDSDEISFDDLDAVPKPRESEYDRMDRIDDEIDSEIRREGM